MSAIYNQKNGELNKADRLALAGLLIKAGYSVRLGKKLVPGTNKEKSVPTVEFFGDGERAE